MRVYQVNPPHGPWVDLDSVQSITPPYVSHINASYSEVVLEWRHAFTDKPTRLWEQCAADDKEEEKARLLMHDKVFVPFIIAWKTGENK